MGSRSTPTPSGGEPARTVYGYISVEHADEAEIGRLHDRLADHARAEGLVLDEVFVDRCVPPGRLVRPGLTILLDTVLRSEASDVLVVDVDHLSSLPPVRRAIEVEIEILGARLLSISSSRADQHHAKSQTPSVAPRGLA